MFAAIFRRGRVLSCALLGGAGVLGSAGTGAAQPVLPLPPEQIQVRFDGIPADPRSGGLNLSLVKVGPLMSSAGRLLGDGSVCPQGGQLTPNGVTLVCVNDASLLEWYKKTLAGSTERKSGSVILMDREHTEVLRTYNLFDCFPTQMRKYEPDDCDDTDSDLVVVELSVGAIEIVASERKAGDIPGKYFIELDGCVAGGACPGATQDRVGGLEICLDAACLATGEQPGSLKMATGFSILLGGDDGCDGVCDLILQSQAKPLPGTGMKATINTTRSNIKHQRTAGPPPAVLDVQGAQIRSVTFPTFQVVPKVPGSDLHMIEKIEIAVEKVERA